MSTLSSFVSTIGAPSIGLPSAITNAAQFLGSPSSQLAFGAGKAIVGAGAALFNKPSSVNVPGLRMPEIDSFPTVNATPIFNPPTDVYGVLSDPFGGAQSLQARAVEDSAKGYEDQAAQALIEAAQEATQKVRQVSAFREEQANKYLGSGVQLEGSPLQVLEETRRLGQQEVDAIFQRGLAQSELYRRGALVTRNQGRAQLLGQRMAYDVQRTQAEIDSARNSARPFVSQPYVRQPFMGGSIATDPYSAAPTQGILGAITNAITGLGRGYKPPSSLTYRTPYTLPNTIDLTIHGPIQ